MNRNRTILPAALSLASLLLSGVTGSFTALAADKKPEVKVDLPAPTKGLRVAVLPVVNGTGEADADKIMEDVLREQFQEVPKERAVFLMPQDVERLLKDANTDRAERVADRWSRYGVLDSTAVVGLDSLFVADALLLIKISEWETKRVHNVGEGQSSTTIGLHMALYRIKDKKKLWSKDPREQRLARELDLTNSSVGYDDTGRIQTPRANEPPRVEEVVSDLIREALKKFPNR
ncbi:MAG: hypothetical protein E6K75_08495 [Candidatus Eisenbacteria bacterium]|uniref:Penicillin-binding protein activator LpoB n=1 Tax=Eiseniibacteriota bacterium TaxID=2212470 RepID=A0A538SA34_UNCEI|nr:MAG: hypothetical protein E6K71_07685 [Candidatus Eisenbacteria bacterium]TMQ56492.1 MAG: hypothetical protein E6K75_08495 [Candidatus Eisenbacteria bacterium]